MLDAHQHYWQLSRFNYDWIAPDNSVLRQDYMPADLWPAMRAAGVQAGVVVQAHNSVDEARWLLELTDHNTHLSGVVGWVDLAALDAPATLADLARHPRFKGVRAQPTGDLCAFERALDALADLGLTCDLLIGPDYIESVVALARSHPRIVFVLDHFAGFRLAPGAHEGWRRQVQPLADLPNVVLKVSGYLTAAEPRPLQTETLRAWVEVAVEVFGAGRLMYGSDWPVCLQAGPYADTVRLVHEATASLDPLARESLHAGTAARVYRLEYSVASSQ
ncbi:MAG: amidohydrolase family protein [Anaerolineae bacterium]|nr:amidohydrolase family protein [Thermoflexales bacterium]MDW8408379.1 amidohydrolase family protein [Anaerolineae bacterium]